MKTTLYDKLNIKPSYTLLVLNAPSEMTEIFKKAEFTPRKNVLYDAVLLFAKEKSSLEKLFVKAKAALKEDGLFWICYPKKNSGIKTDLSRDKGWETIQRQGFKTVTLVSLDASWSAFRFRQTALVKPSKKDSNATSKGNVDTRKFTATLEAPGDGIDGAFVSVPFSVEKVYGAKGHVKVKASFDGHPYRGILANMGTGCHIIIVRKDIRAAIGKNVGDRITVELQRDTEERIVEVPADLRSLFDTHEKARFFFDTLSYTNKKEYVFWITSAKKEETRNARLQLTIQKLLEGKKNPSQKETA